MDVRFPIGHFECGSEIPSAQRKEWIQEIGELPSRLRDAVKDLTDEQLDLSYRDGGWTVRQVVHHLADSHMNSFIRFKLALTEDNPVIKPYYEDRWAELQDSKHTDVEMSLRLLEVLHARWVILFQSMNDADYAKSFYHPESKQTIQLDYNLGYYVWHGKHHTAHITSVKDIINELWQRQPETSSTAMKGSRLGDKLKNERDLGG